MDFTQIIERHMRELHNDLMTQVGGLQQQLDNMKIVNEYLQEQSRAKNDELLKLRVELKERDENIKTAERRVVCLIDGDGYIFNTSLLSRGRPGGRLAAQQLATSIYDQFPAEQYQLHVWVFVNKRGLHDTLRKCNKVEAADGLESFLWGFNQASERFLVVDVGDGKEAVDCKMRAYLDDEAKSSQTVRIIVGGCHDHGYLTTISSLITAGYKQKLVLLNGYAEMAAGFQSIDLPKLYAQDLFERQKLTLRADIIPSPIPSSPPGLSLSPGRPRTSSNASSQAPSKTNPTTYIEALRSPALPVIKRGAAPEQPRVRHMDPNKSVNQQDPPPCNLFYLANTCKKGANCRFAHDYILNPEHYEEMQQNAKKSPCTAVNNGEKCPFGDACCYGHKCPYTTKCFYFKAGTCRFLGAGMHAE